MKPSWIWFLLLVLVLPMSYVSIKGVIDLTSENKELKSKMSKVEYALELAYDSRKDIFPTNGLIDPNTDDYDFLILVGAKNPNTVVVQTRFRFNSGHEWYMSEGGVNTHFFDGTLPTSTDLPVDVYMSLAKELSVMRGVTHVGFNHQDIELTKIGEYGWDTVQLAEIVKRHLTKAVEPVTTGHPF